MVYSFVLITLFGLGTLAAPVLDGGSQTHSPAPTATNVTSLNAIEVPVEVLGGAPEIDPILEGLRDVGVFLRSVENSESKREECIDSPCEISAPTRRDPLPHSSPMMGAPSVSKDFRKHFSGVFRSLFAWKTPLENIRKSNDTTPVVAPVNAQEHGGAPSVDPVIEGLRNGKTIFRRLANGAFVGHHQDVTAQGTRNDHELDSRNFGGQAIPVDENDVELRKLLWSTPQNDA